MRKYKYLLVLPFAIAALTACGNAADNFTEIGYDDAASIADNYAVTIKSNKASSIIVGGHVNKIDFTGDMTWWSAKAIEGAPMSKTLLGLIPNFSVTDSKISVDSEDIVSTTLPGSLVSVAESMLPEALNMKSVAILTVANLPKFPMNHNLLKALTGIKELKLIDPLTKEILGNIDWDNIELKDKGWEHAVVKYFKSGSRLKVTLTTDDIESLMGEIKHVINPEAPVDPEPEKKYGASFSITTNKIGYIDSFGIKLKVDNIDIEESSMDNYYMRVKGNLDMDVALTFNQTISAPINVKYQLIAYHETKEGEQVDATYGPGGAYQLTKEKVIEPTADLKDLKDYVTFDWYSNIETKETTKTLKSVYDDVIFNFNYWKDNDKNVAFTNDSYDVVAIPADKCVILGAHQREFGQSQEFKSLISTSRDGRLISTEYGLVNKFGKLIESAGDVVLENVIMPAKEGEAPKLASLGEIYINSNMIDNNSREFIVNIAVGVLGE